MTGETPTNKEDEMNEQEVEAVEIRVYDGPKVEVTGIVVEAMRAACEVKLGVHFSEAAFAWNEEIDSQDAEQLKKFLMHLRFSVDYAETLLSLAPLDDDEA